MLHSALFDDSFKLNQAYVISFRKTTKQIYLTIQL